MTTTSGPVREDSDPNCMSDATAAAALAMARWRRFVVLGDSIAEGVGEECPGYRDEPWADRVAAVLRLVRPDLVYLNLGKRDLTSVEVHDLQLDEALAFKPDLAAVTAGGNDVLQKSFDPDATEAELGAVIAPLRDAGADVVTMGLFDVSQSDYVPERYKAHMGGRIRELSERTRAISERLGAIYVDLTTHPSGSDNGIYSKDGRHVNMRGHAIVSAVVLRRLAEYLPAGAAGR